MRSRRCEGERFCILPLGKAWEGAENSDEPKPENLLAILWVHFSTSDRRCFTFCFLPVKNKHPFLAKKRGVYFFIFINTNKKSEVESFES